MDSAIIANELNASFWKTGTKKFQVTDGTPVPSILTNIFSQEGNHSMKVNKLVVNFCHQNVHGIQNINFNLKTTSPKRIANFTPIQKKNICEPLNKYDESNKTR